MKVNILLEQIWSGAVTVWRDGEQGEIARGVCALLPVETICLANAEPHRAPRILPEATELLPGLSLGDVLAEELGLTVPFGAVVIFEEVAQAPGQFQSGDEIWDEAAKALQYVGRDVSHPEAATVPPAGFRDDGLNARFFGGQARGNKARSERSTQFSRGDRALG
ncbi:hypothetical protein U879_09575 [Defluviimonas sp. 20V17]|uniref:Uncharacterized protein n=1 Tax=Allgaiera indica TaxID=765699 RepID=A0AAN4UPM4_9RHOB|nr:hypothetical protein [Allgaiera indica]KDB03933.1 hypothetical protein U879_09575 [Defluviimonas sp. 20V17]GHD99224.1 hypothetical protein GCM10008024_05750 [Allgaiera indica]SDW31052.1 hypothetical protein SAMN05444006_102300 [Allgaiera indica]